MATWCANCQFTAAIVRASVFETRVRGGVKTPHDLVKPHLEDTFQEMVETSVTLGVATPQIEPP